MTDLVEAGSEVLMNQQPSMLVVHDYLTQMGGAERVALELARGLSGGRILTSVYDPGNTYPGFASMAVEVLPINKVGLFRTDPRRALPLLGPSFSRVTLDEQVVICSSSGWSHGVTVTGHKVVYCHNPARWIYQADEYLLDQPFAVRAFLRTMRPRLRRWDRHAAMGPRTTYVANSTVVAERIRSAYGLRAVVVPPPVMIDPEGWQDPWPGLEPGYLITVGRPRGYKRTDAVIAAMDQLPGRRLVVVGSSSEATARWEGRVLFMPRVSDAQLRWLYAHSSVKIAVGDEDFGLTPLEANAMGTPVVALAKGGYLDTVVAGVNGVLIPDRTPGSIANGVARLLAEPLDPEAVRAHAARFSPAGFCDRMRAIALHADDPYSAGRHA
jgi:glycosyltransferase involved in cell wall biosynthesis